MEGRCHTFAEGVITFPLSFLLGKTSAPRKSYIPNTFLPKNHVIMLKAYFPTECELSLLKTQELVGAQWEVQQKLQRPAHVLEDQEPLPHTLFIGLVYVVRLPLLQGSVFIEGLLCVLPLLTHLISLL